MTKFLNWILCFPILGSRVKFLKKPVYFNNICWKLRSFFILDNVKRTLPYPQGETEGFRFGGGGVGYGYA